MAPRAIEDQGMVHQEIHPAGIEFERGGSQRQRLLDSALLVLEDAEEMQRFDMVGRKPQHARIKSLRLVENAALVQFERAAHRLDDGVAFLCGQHRAVHGFAPGARPPQA